MEEATHAKSISCDAAQGYRAAIYRRVRGCRHTGHVQVRLLRSAAVSLGNEISFWLWLAQFLCACGRRSGGNRDRREPWHVPHRGEMQPLRRALGACFRGWPESYWAALLHQFAVTKFGRRSKVKRAAKSTRRALEKPCYKIMREMRELRGIACACHHFGYAIAFPHPQEKHLRAGRVFKDIKNVGIAVHFKKSGPPRIRA